MFSTIFFTVLLLVAETARRVVRRRDRAALTLAVGFTVMVVAAVAVVWGANQYPDELQDVRWREEWHPVALFVACMAGVAMVLHVALYVVTSLPAWLIRRRRGSYACRFGTVISPGSHEPVFMDPVAGGTYPQALADVSVAADPGAGKRAGWADRTPGSS